VQLEDSVLRVRDCVQGFTQSAVLRWRLSPGDWLLQDVPHGHAEHTKSLRNNQGHTLTVTADVPMARFEIVEGWESLHYLEKTPVPVLELEVNQPGNLTTEYHWTT